MMSKPKEQDLLSRINAQMSFSIEPDKCNLVWQGYLAGLYEWDQIDLDVYTRLQEQLPKKGGREIAELFLGHRLTPEQEDQLTDE
jgi:hypothetical protein